MCHHQCLQAAEKMGAMPPTLAMIRAFLTQQTMTVKVHGSRSDPRPVCGGSPQGSILATDQFIHARDHEREITPSIAENGLDISQCSSNDAVGRINPITRPIVPMSQPLTDSEDEDEIRAENFIYFPPLRRIEDTVLSERGDQSAIDNYFCIPPGWDDAPVQIQVYIDDMNCIEKVKQTNAVSTISSNKRILKIHFSYNNWEILFFCLFL